MCWGATRELNRAGRCSLTARLFGELDEDAFGRLRMDERHTAPAGPVAGCLVDQLIAGRPAGGQGGVEIRDPVADVVDPGPAPGEESADGRVLLKRLEQFDLGATEVEVDNPGTIGDLRAAGLDLKYVAVEGKGVFNAPDRDTKVRNGRLHDGQILHQRDEECSRMSGATVEVTDATWQAEVADAKGLVLVDFWAAWCGPCRMIAPTLEALATDYAGKAKIAKLDVDANQDSAMKFNVRSIPAVLFFKDGKHIDSLIGAMPRGAFEQKIKEHLAA